MILTRYNLAHRDKVALTIRVNECMGTFINVLNKDKSTVCLTPRQQLRLSFYGDYCRFYIKRSSHIARKYREHKLGL